MPQFPTSGAFGQDIGRATQYIGQLGAQRAIEMKQTDDENAAFDAFHRAASASNAYLNGANGQPGLYARQGMAALGATGEAKQMLGEIGRQAIGSLQTEGSKFRFDRMWRQRSVSLEHQVSDFERDQRAVASNQIVGAAKNQALQDVASNPDPDMVFDAKSNALAVYRANGRSDIEIAEVFLAIDETASENRIRRMIRQAPLETAQLLSDDEGLFAEWPLEKREVWRERAMNEYEQRSRIALAEEERDRRAAERREKELQEQFAKEGDLLLAKGQMSLPWIEQNIDNLADGDRRFYIGKVTGTSAEQNRDPEVFDDLYELAREGEDVYELARQAYTSNPQLITRDDYTTILARSEREVALPGKAKEAYRYLETAFGDDANLVQQGSRTRKADGIVAFSDWLLKNQDATREEMLSEAKSVVSRYSIVSPQEMVTTLEPPMFRVGPRLSPEIEATFNSTESAFREGLLSEKAYQEQVILIDKWDQVLEQLAEMQKPEVK